MKKSYSHLEKKLTVRITYGKDLPWNQFQGKIMNPFCGILGKTSAPATISITSTSSTGWPDWFSTQIKLAKSPSYSKESEERVNPSGQKQ